MLLKSGTWNIASGLGPDLPAMAGLIQQQGLDLIGLQEVDRQTRRCPHAVAEELADYLGWQVFFAPIFPLMGGEYGLALLSRWPLQARRVIHYRAKGAEPRILQMAQLRLAPGIELMVVNTHLSFETPALRQQQMRQLQQELAPVIQRRQPLLITGDFNTDQRVTEWADFKGPWQLTNGAAGQWQATFQADDPAMRTRAIDNILFANGPQLQRWQVETTPLSDHALLRAEFQLG